MKNHLLHALAIVVILMLAWLGYAMMEIGITVLRQPTHDYTIGTAIGMCTLATLAACLLIIARKLLCWLKLKAHYRMAIQLGLFGMVWAIGVYSLAAEYCVYFGNTWTTSELWLGFIALSAWAWISGLLAIGAYGWLASQFKCMTNSKNA